MNVTLRQLQYVRAAAQSRSISAAAKQLGEEAVRLAVTAHIRHAETPYDVLLARGEERQSTRVRVDKAVRRVLKEWEDGRG